MAYKQAGPQSNRRSQSYLIMSEMQRRPPIGKAVIVAGETTTTTPPRLPQIISFTGLFCLAGG
jgi:hypothetical protein